jgi:hypothetical protein
MQETDNQQPETPPSEQFEEAIGAAEAETSEMAFVAPSESGKRSTALILVGLVMLGAGTIYFMRMKAGPATAAAATPEASTAQSTINEFLSDGGKNLKLMRDLLRNTEKVVQQFLNYPSTTQIGLDDLKTNPFRFAPPKKDDDEVARKKKEEEQARLQKEKTAIAAAVGQLKLQSIISGSRPTCMIGNQVYAEGQEVDGFTIEKIRPNGVVVKKATYRFELRMQK